MRELQKRLFGIERVLKGTFFSIFLFKCKTSKKTIICNFVEKDARLAFDVTGLCGGHVTVKAHTGQQAEEHSQVNINY